MHTQHTAHRIRPTALSYTGNLSLRALLLLLLPLAPACRTPVPTAPAATTELHDAMRPPAPEGPPVDWDEVAAEADDEERSQQGVRAADGSPTDVSAAVFARRATAARDYDITLSRSFIERIKNRVTVRTPFDVRFATFHSQAKDGDVHVAGYTEDIGLPVVAELMNWRLVDAAAQAIRDADDRNDVIDVQGVWRLWCEHPGGTQVQYGPIPTVRNSNPDHVFEIHPLTKVAGHSVSSSTLRVIAGYNPKPAARAFNTYDQIPCRLIPDDDAQTCTITTKKIGYNYVEFKLRIAEDEQFEAFDGRFVRATPLDLNDRPVSRRTIRMVFPRGSEAETAVRSMGRDEVLHVLGMPRMDLAVISWRLRNAKQRPEVLTWSLPYEIVVVGLYP